MQGKIILGLVALFMAAALIPLPVWAHGAAPMVVISLLISFANLYVLSQPMPARHCHQEPRGRGPA